MSSAASTALRLELEPDGVVLSGLAIWGALLIACLWRAALSPAISWTVSIAVVVAIGSALRSQLFGWSARAPVGIAWGADGAWSLRWPDGSSRRAVIARSSHAFPGGALLVFRGGPWMLLRERCSDPGELRRMRVRMHLEGLRPTATRPGAGGS
jgi:hypothetical protein